MALRKHRRPTGDERVTIYSLKPTKDRFQESAREFSQQSDPFLNALLNVWDGLTFEEKARAVALGQPAGDPAETG